jgi:hypothetical protein
VSLGWIPRRNFAQKKLQPLHELLLHGVVLWSAEKVPRLVRVTGQIVPLPFFRILRVPLNQLVGFGAYAAVRFLCRLTIE